MINYPRTHRIIAWTIFALSLLVYALTLAPTASFWDCGEFIAGSYRLQTVHPPGAPLYQLLGRLFSFFSVGNVQQVAFWVNMLSAVCSAFCVMLTYLIAAKLAPKIVNPMGLPLAFHQHLSIWGAGAVAALTLAFTDTFWFSAVEAEVYALSSCFTMLVLWAALKWEENKSNRYHVRWLLFIAYATGLSIGIHLLNLLVIPAVTLIIYFGLKPYSFWGLVKGSAIGVGLLLIIQFGIIPVIPSLAFVADRFAVNQMGWSAGKGAWLFIGLLASIVILALAISHQKKWHNVQLVFLCLAFVLIGFSSYIIIPVRAAAQPPLNVNHADNAAAFSAYINREQYGSRALAHGPAFNAPIDSFVQGKPQWRMGDDGKYHVVGHTTNYLYNPAYMLWFPRVGDVYSKNSAEGYAGWTGIDPDSVPTQAKNLEFFFKYHLLHMYVRYHLWNFAARQNDLQGHGNALDGNGLTGFSFIDDSIAAPQQGAPPIVANNKANNNYYMLPLLLGIVGLFFQAKRNKEGFWPMLLFFLFTGALLAVYLNIPPFEPRERDYAFVGSFQAFSIWVGLGALWLMRFLHIKVKKGIWLGLIAALCASPAVLISQNWDDHDRSQNYFARDYAVNFLQNLAPNAIVFVQGDNDTYPLWYLQNVEGFRTDVRVINTSLLGTDWAAFDLVRPQYQSAPLKLSISPYQYQQGKMAMVKVVSPNYTQPSTLHFVNALEVLAADSGNTETLSTGNLRCVLPAKKLVLSFSNDSSTTGRLLEMEMTAPFLSRAEVLLIDILANNPDRVVYFSSRNAKNLLPQLQSYWQYEGLVHRLGHYPQPDWKETSGSLSATDFYALVKQWNLRGYSSPKNYIDPEARKLARHYMNICGITTKNLLREGQPQKAAELAAWCIDAIGLNVVEIADYYSPVAFADALYAGGQTQKANEYAQQLTQRLMAEATYYHSLKNTIADYTARKEIKIPLKGLRQLKEVLNSHHQTQKAQEIEKFLIFFAPPKPQP